MKNYFITTLWPIFCFIFFLLITANKYFWRDGRLIGFILVHLNKFGYSRFWEKRNFLFFVAATPKFRIMNKSPAICPKYAHISNLIKICLWLKSTVDIQQTRLRPNFKNLWGLRGPQLYIDCLTHHITFLIYHLSVCK